MAILVEEIELVAGCIFSQKAFNVQNRFQILALTSAVLVYIRDEDVRIMFHFELLHIVRRIA